MRAMKYTNLIIDYLQANKGKETWDTLAKRAGVSRAALYKFLKGINRPRFDTLEKLLLAAGYCLKAIPNDNNTPTPQSVSPEAKGDA